MIGTQALSRSRGILSQRSVEERSESGEVETASLGGALGSEYPDMSNDKYG